MALLVAVACSGGDDDSPAPTQPPAATSAPEASATEGPPATTAPIPTQQAQASPTPAAGIEALSLVWVDTRKGQGSEVYVAAHDGTDPRLVATVQRFRPLDVAGGELAAADQDDLLFINLQSGQTRSLPVAGAAVFDGRFVDERTFVYTTRGGCPQSSGAFYRVDVPTLRRTELLDAEQGLTIAGIDAAAGLIALAPRGCDVAVTQVNVHNVQTGAVVQSFEVDGCGWVIAAPAQNKAAASWQACTPPDGHAGAEATAYDFGIVGPSGQDVTAPDEGSNAQPWLLQPGGVLAALGTMRTVGAGPGSERGGGVYLFDLTTRQFRRIVAPEGAEQFAVAWSGDGDYLLYAVVEAMGVCHFGFVAVGGATTAEAIDAEVTVCGVNGEVVGWTRLP